MKIRPKGFCRICDNLCMINNPRTEGFVLIKDASDFLQPLITGENPLFLTYSLATKYQVSEDEVYNDMMSLYIDLSNSGHIDIIHDNKWKRNSHVVAKEIEQQLNSTQAEQKSIDDFYGEFNLLEELHVDLTDACTERCVHCYVPQGQCDYLTYDLAEKVLREFREQQGLTVQLSGGECMMHPDFARICKLCRKLDLNFIVLSNLTRCDEKIIEVLKETDPQFVNVSLYSLAPEEHDAITQIRGSWKKTMAAIDACQQAGIHIRLATPLLKANQHAYPALRKFAEERHVHLVPDCEIIPKCNGDCSNLNYACSPEEVEAVLRQDKAFWDRGYGRGVIPSPKDKVCDIGKLLCLNSKGEYYPCSGMHGYVLGNARNDTLTEVWRGEKMEYLRGLKNKDFPKCAGCEHRPFCKVCPAFNYNATGSLFETIPAKCARAEVKHRVFGEK